MAEIITIYEIVVDLPRPGIGGVTNTDSFAVVDCSEDPNLYHVARAVVSQQAAPVAEMTFG